VRARFLAAVAAAGLVLSGCTAVTETAPTPTVEPTPDPSPTEFKARGTLIMPLAWRKSVALQGRADGALEAGGPCLGAFLDIKEGASLRVTDMMDTQLATGTLSVGEAKKPPAGLRVDGICEFEWSVDHVPIGYDWYGVRMGERWLGEPAYTRQALYRGVRMYVGWENVPGWQDVLN